MPLRDYPKLAIIGESEALRQIINLRSDDQAAIRTLEATKFNGRDRTGIRAVPTSNTDLLVGDTVGDRVNDTTHIYFCMNIPGTGVQWRKVDFQNI